MSAVSINPGDRVFGYLMTNSHCGFLGALDIKDSREAGVFLGMSVGNLLGYIPGVSVIVGIARIIFSQMAAFFTEATGGKAKALQEAQLVRGVMECCTVFGPLMVISDIVASIFFLIMASQD